jgi:putative transposase
VIKTYKFRIYPTRAQQEKLEQQLALCCELYNAAVQERRDAYRIAHKSITYIDQQNQLPEIKEIHVEFREMHSQVSQDVLRRVEKAFDNFFRRVKSGEQPGYPRFRSVTRYDSFTYPQSGFHLEGAKLVLSKIGKVRIKQHRAIAGKIKTLTIIRSTGRWYACFSLEIAANLLPYSSESVGIDVGLTAFATMSDSSQIENPRIYRNAAVRLRVAQRRVARRKKGSKGRRKAVAILQRKHESIRNKRKEFLHQESRKIVNRYGMIFVEDLNIKGLAGGMFAKSVNDASWGAFQNMLAYKAEEALRREVAHIGVIL